MTELARLYGISYMIFARGELGQHNRPHIHVDYNGQMASIDIETGKILAGELSTPTAKKVRAFVKEHREELLAAWNTMQRGASPSRILPAKPRKNPTRRRKSLPFVRLLEWLGKNEVRLFFSDGRVVEIFLPWVKSAKKARIVDHGCGIDPGDGLDVAANTLYEMKSVTVRAADR